MKITGRVNNLCDNRRLHSPAASAQNVRVGERNGTDSATRWDRGAAMKPVGTYRVVGLRADGTRTVLLEGASPREAARVRIQVLNANAFPDVLIERENGHEGDNTKNTSPPRRP